MSTATWLAERYAAHGVPAVFVPADGGADVPCTVRFEYAGQIEVAHGKQEQALVKVLWTDFPEPPEGVFLINEVEWTVLAQAGTVDGFKAGLQRALLCGSERTFSVEK